MDLKKNLSPIIRTPRIRTKKSTALVYFFIFVMIVCMAFFLINNTHTNLYSDWLKNKSQIHLYFSQYLFGNHDSLYTVSDSFPRKRNSIHRKQINSHLHLNDSASVKNSNAVPNSDPTSATSSGNIGNDSRVNDQMTNMNGKRRKGSSRDTDISKRDKNNRENGKSTGDDYKKNQWLEKMNNCDIFDGRWVKDSSPPLYEPGSCPYIDESFDCNQNGRLDNGYLKFRWQPNHCSIPRLDGKRMLRFMKGKRIVYVGDSLNRNMWESMVCLLRNAVKDKSRVFEASGRVEFKKEGAYSFLFPDYNCSVEYVRSAFLVQEWEIPVDKNGSTKETLRLDLVENQSDMYKDADVLVFNTGHWWTHEKTSEGKGYYQEGDHVHHKLDVVEAFNKAMSTWARWMKYNINPLKTYVFFRGYSLTHFSEGEWNTGGKCHNNTEPIKDEKDLVQLNRLYPPIPQLIEKSLKRMKTPVLYLNVTGLTNYRKDAHPSMYRKANMTRAEKQMFLTHQDCSHWCLPGVPDTWNQLLFAKLLLSHKQRREQQQNNRSRLVNL